jgi:hypothetical protein
MTLVLVNAARARLHAPTDTVRDAGRRVGGIAR